MYVYVYVCIYIYIYIYVGQRPGGGGPRGHARRGPPQTPEIFVLLKVSLLRLSY